MQFVRKCVFVIISLLATVGMVTAQGECPDAVDDALFSLSDLCLGIGRNQACYGNGDIIAVPVQNSVFDFTVPGDTAFVDEIDSLSLSPFVDSIDDWGVAILVVQADIPDTLPGQNVTMVIFGDANLSNDNGAYYFTSGIGAPDCNQAPNGMLIQTPEGAGQVNLTMNGIDIAIGSTAYFGSLEDDELLIALLEGSLGLSIDGSSVELDPDFYTTIAIDEDGNATGEFSEPESIDELELPTLPTDFLPESLEDTEDDASTAVSGDLIIPQSGLWSATIAEDITFGEDCPAFFVDSFNAQSMEQFGVTNGMTQELVFDDEDILGPLFLDLAGPAFEAAGASLTIDDSVTNVYHVTIGIEGAFTINYTWTVLSETLIEGTIEQAIAMDPISCTVETWNTFQYEG